jgi:glutathione reductase (NADPH)
MTYDYDLLVLGAGSGGLAAAKRSASYGAKVAIIENDLVGGTCVIRGCVPKKLFVYASQFSHVYHDAVGYGWESVTPAFHWSRLTDAVDKEINRLSRLHIGFLEKAGVDLIHGTAAFVDPHTVKVDDKSDAHGSSRHISAERIVISTGGKAILPKLPGIEHAVTSREVFKLPKQPKNMAIIGGGYIGVEFAGVFNGLGTQVTQIIRKDKILRGFDEDIRDHVQRSMIERGITMLTNTEVERLEKTEEGTQLIFKGDQVAPMVVDAAVLFATGRAPNTAELCLENAGVDVNDDAAVVVDGWSQTCQPHIYAIGDVTNRVNLTPVAVDEGRAFADTVYGNAPRKVNYDNIATAVFSQPEAATVGLTEREAIARVGQDNLQIYRSSFRPLFHSLTGVDEKTVMKLLVDRQTDRVLGAHMVGKDAAEIIQSVAIAINMGATKQDFDNTMALHPSTAEEFVTMR